MTILVTVWLLNALAADAVVPPAVDPSRFIQATLNQPLRSVTDALQRLTSEALSGGTPSGTLTYGFDRVSNRKTRNAALGLSAQALNYDLNDWLDNDAITNNASVYFDAKGSTASYGGVTLQYDCANRLTNYSTGPVAMVYNGDGWRVKKTVAGTNTTWYLVDEQNPTGYPLVLEELSTPGATPTRLYTYGLDLISQRQSGGTTHYYVTDGLGSTRHLLNSAGSLTVTNVFDAFGNRIYQSGSTPNNYLFAGEQYDANLSRYFLRARYLSAATGRFLTMDSGQGSPTDSLSLHKYLYAHNNPVNGTDPSGHEFTLAGINASTAIQYTLRTMAQGAVIGGAVGEWDAIIGGRDPLRRLTEGAVSGALLGPFARFRVVQLLGVSYGAVQTGIAIGEGQNGLATYRAVVTAAGAALFVAGDVYVTKVNGTPRYTIADVRAAIARLDAKGIRPNEFQSHIDPDNVIRIAELMRSGTFDPALMRDPVIFETTSKSLLSGHHRSIAAEMAGFDLPQTPTATPGTQAGEWSEIPLIPGRRN